MPKLYSHQRKGHYPLNIFGFHSPSLAALLNKNTVLATYVILYLLVVTFKN